MPEENDNITVPLFPQSGFNERSRVWTVGYEGLFRVTLTLADTEREIDVDDNGSFVDFTLEMRDTGSFNLDIEVQSVRLFFDFSNKNILVDDWSRSDEATDDSYFELIKLADPIDKRRLSPGGSLVRRIHIKTGVFSSRGTPKTNGPARPGYKEMDVKIIYKVIEPDDDRRTVRKPATMVFLVAAD